MRAHRVLLFLCCLFFILRMWNLSILPIFNDEAVHIDWGYKELHGNGLFYSLFDAKQPLLMWLFGLSQLVVPDPLIAGRLVSVLFGLASLVGIYKLSEYVFTKKIALYSACAYICTPLFVFFDRQALMEGPLVAISIWSIYLYLKIWHKPSVSKAIALGAVLAAGFFIKTTALFFLLALIAVFLYEIIVQKRKYAGPLKASLLLALSVSQLLLAPLYFQPQFWSTLSRTAERSLGFKDLISLPFSQWWQTITAVAQITWWHLTPPLVILAIIGAWRVYIYHYKKKAHHRALWMYADLIIFFYILTARSSPVRYIVPLLAFTPILVGAALAYLEKWKLAFIGALISLCVPLFLIFQLYTNPLNYFAIMSQFTPYSQKDEYVTAWPAGYGVTELLSEVRKKVGAGTGVVAARADAGIPESAVFSYLNGDRQLLPIFLDTTVAPLVLKYECIQSNKPFFFVSRDTQLGGLEAFLTEQGRIQKPEGKSSLGLYTLKTCTTGQKILNLEFE